MSDLSPEETSARGPAEDGPGEPTAELVVPERRTVVVRPRGQFATARAWLLELRHHPAAVASVSAAATLGGAALLTGLRHVLSQAAGAPARTGSLAVSGYVVHEVHVVHHVVHHLVREIRADR